MESTYSMLLGLRIRVVHAQVAEALVVAGQPEVEVDGLGVADVEVAVGLGRETGVDPVEACRTGGARR